MRSYVLPLALALSVGLAGAAMAKSTTTTGIVKAFDAKTHSLTLEDGTVYKLSSKFKDPGLKAGEKVSVLWTMKGKDHDASKVKIVK